MKIFLLSASIVFCFLLSLLLHGQESTDYKWMDPVQNNNLIFQGQGWEHSDLASPYDRLPSKAENTVRKAVWNLSHHNAGIYLTFTTDAPEMKVRYQVTSNRYEMPHMPSTGVSGLDLYVHSPGSKELLWCRGRYSFGDTITYTYSALNTRLPHPGESYSYQLYLPLYNAVKWMEIGIPQSSKIIASESEKSKPIVVYGTSIAQGGCASRPAMAWSSIVQRNLDQPVINLAFSGNGRLEPEVIALINEIDAGLFILDCLPNLTNEETYPDKELRKRIRHSVQSLRASHPGTPILLTAHAGYSDDQVSEGSYERVKRANNIQKSTYDAMKSEGLKNLYYLRKDEIDMCMDCTVDGTHQTDLGMEYYARAYLKKIHEILTDSP